MRQKSTRHLALLVLVFLLPVCNMVGLIGCATKQASVEDAALTVGELALAVDQAERTAFEGGLYDQARHTALGKQVLRLLYAARAFERSVAVTDGSGDIRTELRAAVESLYQAVQDVPGLRAAVEPLRNLLGGV